MLHLVVWYLRVTDHTQLIIKGNTHTVNTRTQYQKFLGNLKQYNENIVELHGKKEKKTLNN